MKQHTLSVLVENRAGVLSRVAAMFSRRGFNIESLAVGTCEEPDMSRITIVVNGDDGVVEQMMKQTNKLIDVIKVSDLTARESVERELALIKVAAETGPARAEILQIADIFRALVVDVGAKTLVLQVTGDTSKIDALETLLRQYGIKELVRTGKIALLRGPKTVKSSK
ncbi:MAG: Acetolactate synthase, small subunit [Methanoculleus marisnigri]|jgi:acetolactate synthase-1/3 small subunit|uniref:Acetolactate synthase small subunit n=1 Tax=Methanoculleus marisnigri TaxID=2198 RepID=A0A117LRI5_9EURY|nr:acetolactate synthase small subunit [Methanoculleus marisnigri]KUK63447.1 MAG: Acetolactate synthase, small subunit [Methanoculleus marisnigri]KUL02633.1 MAG: Acetolactate synthase, small subunit [Methanoculleus marisnigri]MCK9307714.1 acetolactate synthase small subunit [Methanoculleus sp.]